MENTVKVFTAKSVDRILKEGGTSSWKLNQRRARQMEYAVCYRNVNRTDELGGGPTPERQHESFLIGRIRDIVPSPSHPDRWLIRFGEYARLDGEEKWAGDRNPVIYDDIEELEIDLTDLEWMPMPQTEPIPERPSHEVSTPDGMSIDDAKKGLAQRFGVREDQVRITIEA
ncbi:MAG: hypothetical protein R3229_16890 [Alphaproteobacteria bacterium]|nr:hypothetical protein [Alphaproteobacteria bacterium]